MNDDKVVASYGPPRGARGPYSLIQLPFLLLLFTLTPVSTQALNDVGESWREKSERVSFVARDDFQRRQEHQRPGLRSPRRREKWARLGQRRLFHQ